MSGIFGFFITKFFYYLNLIWFCSLFIKSISLQGLISKEKVDTDGEKCAQISTVSKTVTQGWSEIMIIKYKQAIHYNCFLFSRWVYITLLISPKSWTITFTSYFNF